MVDLLGIDKPRSWKYEKINNKEVLVHRGRKGSLYPDKALEDMMYALKKKKFNVYRVSNCPYAFVFGVKTTQENDDLTMIEHIHPEPNCVKL